MSNETITYYFVNYEESTLDPGWSLVVGSVLACTLLHLTLPCIVSLGGRYEEETHLRTKCSIATSGASGSDSSMRTSIRSKNNEWNCLGFGSPSAHTNGRVPTETTITRQQVGEKRHHSKVSRRKDDKRSVLETVKEDEQSKSTMSSSMASSSRFLQDSRLSPSRQKNRPENLSRKGLRESRGRGHKSPSSTSGSLITMSSIAESSSVFSGRPARQPGLKRNLGKDLNYEARRKRDKRTPKTRRQSKTTAHLSTRAKGKSSIDHQSLAEGSAMSQLHYDDVSFTEAIDSYDNNATQYMLPNMKEPGEIDICFGEHVWYKPSMIIGALDRIIGIAEYDDEFSAVVHLAVPFSIQSFVTGMFNIIDVALVCHLYGGMEANVFVVVPMLTWITNTVNYGFCEALGKTIPEVMLLDTAEETKGRSKSKYNADRLSGKYLNTSLSLYTFGMIPTVLIWSLGTKSIFLWFGFDEETAILAQDYAFLQICSEWITGIEYCIHLFLDLIGHEKYSTYTLFAQSVGQTLSVIIPKLLLLGHTRDDLLLVGFFRVMILGILMFLDTCIVLYYGWIESFASGFLAIPFQDWDVVQKIVSNAGPLGVAYFLTYGQWELLALFARALGPAEVVAWGISGSIFSVMKYTTDGIADAAEVRCALHLVSNEPELARLSTYKSLFLGFVLSILVTSILFMLGEQIAPCITPDVTLQMLMIEIFPLIGIGHIVATSGTISWALVGAQGRYNLATVIHFVGSWGVTFPLSCIFAFGIRLDLQGLASAVVMGLAASSSGNLYILIRSQWQQVSNLYSNETNDDTSADSPTSRLPFDLHRNVNNKGVKSPLRHSKSAPPTAQSRAQNQQQQRKHVAFFDANSSKQPLRMRFGDDDSSVVSSSITGYTG